MTIYFTLASVAGISEQLAKAGQLNTIAAEAADSGEGVLATIAHMIVEAPEYPGPSFLDRPKAPAKKAPKAEHEEYAASLSAYLLSQDPFNVTALLWRDSRIVKDLLVLFDVGFDVFHVLPIVGISYKN